MSFSGENEVASLKLRCSFLGGSKFYFDDNCTGVQFNCESLASFLKDTNSATF